ncbi:MAG: carbamate kinase [Myxococcales bacterium]|nr:carbamate kinase [Myxococcales bacterium]
MTIAVGGNALLRRGEPLTADVQRANVLKAAAVLSEIARDHETIITHGNGPQVGLLALQAESYKGVQPYPLDVLGAESEGMLGYLIEQELSNALPNREVAAILTRVEVDPRDPAFGSPTKPIGPVYDDKQKLQRIATERGWSTAADGAGFRRVVASPRPLRILELRTIALLVDAGHIVVCAGGGGIPVVQAADGSIHGVEAVVDKDLTASLLASELKADRLLLLTDVAGVYSHWPDQSGDPIRTITPEELSSQTFDPGSMGPKVEAACEFVRRTSKTAVIGALRDAPAALRGEAGTQICFR